MMTPIFKSKDKSTKLKERPISVLPCYFKDLRTTCP